MPGRFFGLFASTKFADPRQPKSANHPSLWVRLRVRRQRRQLDAALAGGADPGSSDELALRAEQLREPATRLWLASQIENIYRLATEGPGARASTAMSPGFFDGFRVAANRPALEALAARLRDRGPHSLRGLALSAILIEDKNSPLYARSGVDKLDPAVQEATAALAT